MMLSNFNCERETNVSFILAILIKLIYNMTISKVIFRSPWPRRMQLLFVGAGVRIFITFNTLKNSQDFLRF